VDVEVRFAPEVAERVEETVWHASQTVEQLADGSVVLHLQVAEPTELKHWVLGWGPACKVIAPPTFRDDVAHEAAAMANLYAEVTPAFTRLDSPRAG
jgi:proteasome accessory factor B